MKKLLNLILTQIKNNNKENIEFKSIKSELEINKIFSAINEFSEESEIRYVGGCIRKILSKEKVDDIDLATNLNPNQICEALDKEKIKFYKTGFEHGTVTAIVNDKKFEITTLRKDISTDGRKAVVEFTNNWELDAMRRDFTINAIYSDIDGNLFDPTDGKKDILIGKVKFIGNAEERIKEDYLRILRYIRFFINYSKFDHDTSIKKIIKKNITGIKYLSNERLLSELKKIIITKNFLNIIKDGFLLEIILLIFPQLESISRLKKLNEYSMKIFPSKDSIFKLALLVIDDSDNIDFFLYKFHFSNDEKKRILFLKNAFKNLNDKKYFSEKNLCEIFYFYGKEYLIDLVDFKIFNSKKVDKKLLSLKNIIITKGRPVFPIKAKDLMKNYHLKEGKELGNKLKKIEKVWIDNSFNISNIEIENIIYN